MEQLTAFLVVFFGLGAILALPIPFAYLFNRLLGHKPIRMRATLAALCGSACLTAAMRLVVPSLGLFFDMVLVFVLTVTLALPMFPVALSIAKMRTI